MYTVIPIQNMISIMKTNNKFDRIYELTIYLLLGYIGILDEKLGDMKNKVLLMNILLIHIYDHTYYLFS